MKLAIISDTHLGHKQYRTDERGFNRFEHIGYKVCKEFTQKILDSNPDLVINAGDIFDTPNPPILAMKNYLRMQTAFENANIPTMAILGNHDFSFNNRNNHCSAADMASHTYFTDYELKTVEIDDILFVLMPYIYDKHENIKQMFYDCRDIVKSSTQKKKILVTHGITQRYHNESLINDQYMLIPDKLIALFDLCIIGHIHNTFEYKEGDCFVLSPGAMIDYQAYEDRTGPIIFDTNTMTYERIMVKTPHIIKKTCTEENINDILSNVTEDIYHINYKGDTSKIDNDLFIKAKEIAVNLVIDVIQEEEIVEKEHNSTLLNFNEWLSQHYSEYVDIFQKARGEISSV